MKEKTLKGLDKPSTAGIPSNDGIRRINKKFTDTCERLDKEIRNRIGKLPKEKISDKDLKKDATLREKIGFLDNVRYTRDVLSHNNTKTSFPFIVTKDFLDEVNEFLKDLELKAEDIYIPFKSITEANKSITAAKLGEKLGSIVDDMRKKSYSHIPIIDDNERVIGVFNEIAAFNYLWDNSIKSIDQNMRLSKDIFEYCRIEKREELEYVEIYEIVKPNVSVEDFGFVKPSISADKIKNLFKNPDSDRTRIGAVFVTQSGKKEGKLQGMITPWDDFEKKRKDDDNAG